jgi:hypothetical protein
MLNNSMTVTRIPYFTFDLMAWEFCVEGERNYRGFIKHILYRMRQKTWRFFKLNNVLRQSVKISQHR